MNQPAGGDILLRRYRAEDSLHIHEWANVPATTRWLGRRYREPRSLETIRASLDRIIAAPPVATEYFAIADRRTGACLGGIDLTSIDRTDRNGILSTVIARACSRNRGIGSAAVRLLPERAFGPLGLHKVELRVSAGGMTRISGRRGTAGAGGPAAGRAPARATADASLPGCPKPLPPLCQPPAGWYMLETREEACHGGDDSHQRAQGRPAFHPGGLARLARGRVLGTDRRHGLEPEPVSSGSAPTQDR